jgi:signal transduction histidine kinase
MYGLLMGALEQERVGVEFSSESEKRSPAAERFELSPLISRAAAQLAPLLLFGAGYTLASRYAWSFSENNAAPLWFPDSVLLCALLLTPKKRWLAYVLVGLPIRLAHTGVPTWFLSVTYLNDCLKAAFSAYLLQRLIPGVVRLNTVRQFGIYIGVAGLVAPALSALAGAASRLAVGAAFWTSWYQWFLGDAITNLVLTPTLLYWSLREWGGVRARAIELLVLILILAAVLYFIFIVPQTGYSPVVIYAPVPFLVVAATRFKPIGVSTAISLLALIATVSTVAGKGPFVTTYSQHVVLSMQLFLAVISVPMLFVAILIEERQAIENALRDSRAVLKENCERVHDLAGKLLRAQEDECRRIARELHDDIGQRLSLLSVSMDELGRELPLGSDKERTLAQTLLRETQGLATDIHELSHQLHSTTLRHMGLETALRSLCRTIERQQHVAIEFQSDHIDGLPEEISLSFFRVAQEALNNAVRHGKATKINVSLRKQEEVLCMKVRDSGLGFVPANVSDGLGLVSMQERLRFLGGRVVVSSQPGEGTEVNAELPMRESA